jgi:CheY-like chemotaxis protein
VILIVEDDEQVARLIELVLKRVGRESHIVGDGQEALSFVTDNDVEIVFADLGVRGLSGDKLCAALKSDEKTRHIPFVVLSGDRDIEEKASTCGADGFLGKPFEFDDLIRVVESYAHDKKTS